MSSYQFALIDRTTARIGVGLQNIVRSWSELERWFHSKPASRQIAIGYISYEQQIYFGIFESMQKIPLSKLIATSPFTCSKLRGLNFTTYRKNFNRIQRHLAIGDIYQANYCYRLTGQTNATPNQLLYHFVQRQPTPYTAFINTPDVQIISNSPELGLSIHDDLVESRPMKGTRPRGTNTYQTLLHSAKDKAELDMIVDVVRNDLAQFAVPGSVVVKKRRQIVGYNTVWQAQAVIQARRPKSVSTLAVLKTILPFASVTGAPKLRAVQILKQLEPYKRGVYCGGIGYIAGKNRAEFNVAIRTATLSHGQLHYSVGGGITVDSDPKQEYQETLDKAAVLY
ncbi:MAG: anthranilate synthase component I family protein [Candidatus Kerfeldbacteria bacterium]|nr:anthranilate synthase component I family protein [Candidatus Kerfeldbacteria bacterium]